MTAHPPRGDKELVYEVVTQVRPLLSEGVGDARNRLEIIRTILERMRRLFTMVDFYDATENFLLAVRDDTLGRDTERRGRLSIDTSTARKQMIDVWRTMNIDTDALGRLPTDREKREALRLCKKLGFAEGGDAWAFCIAIAMAPRDDAPRLILADWLEERGADTEAEFLRWEVRERRAEDVTIRWEAKSHIGHIKRQWGSGSLSARNALAKEFGAQPFLLDGREVDRLDCRRDAALTEADWARIVELAPQIRHFAITPDTPSPSRFQRLVILADSIGNCPLPLSSLQIRIREMDTHALTEDKRVQKILGRIRALDLHVGNTIHAKHILDHCTSLQELELHFGEGGLGMSHPNWIPKLTEMPIFTRIHKMRLELHMASPYEDAAPDWQAYTHESVCEKAIQFLEKCTSLRELYLDLSVSAQPGTEFGNAELLHILNDARSRKTFEELESMDFIQYDDGTQSFVRELLRVGKNLRHIELREETEGERSSRNEILTSLRADPDTDVQAGLKRTGLDCD